MRPFATLFAIMASVGILAACSPLHTEAMLASAQPVNIQPVNAHCDEYEGYPDCYPDHPLSDR